MCIFIVGLSQAILSHFAGNGLRSSVVVAGNGRDRRSPVMVAVVKSLDAPFYRFEANVFFLPCF